MGIRLRGQELSRNENNHWQVHCPRCDGEIAYYTAKRLRWALRKLWNHPAKWHRSEG